ncbi:carboxylating nicotinate-nucleotide diphosphorylase [Blastopirellula sp. JC732]|uniref:Probable nicotinate-nucleotide pyrophosphorylase [carboxylating] n=1 Tax=Blastopirellula sediminis TaxID=2894196 RepID=A0A9X1SJA6_9BACT|nr:carboxylating nicotinate-nucleotide diphosphorylase [Blastopirellula sediminis]MCC9604544.1 carboxylating nicotinate-nucleotide diphosphorylase [Blastopirellula sediminis]MCC9632157.1 carboxylating nicotinate-nucleotide diphosphorylase [Blastopirellula sediminis]
MPKEYRQVEWDAQLADDCRHLIRLAFREDLDNEQDWSTVSLVAADAQGSANITARASGVLAGTQLIPLIIEEAELELTWTPQKQDGDAISRGDVVGTLSGSVRDLLTSERTILNFICRLTGIATLTRTYVEAATGSARVYDTRKTTPGWRRLEKYAVRCGGGVNHRVGLFAAVMAKDNHLAWSETQRTLADITPQVRQFLTAQLGEAAAAEKLVEIEVDSLEQLEAVLPSQPDIILLDNMPPETLRAAVEMRNRLAPSVELEASGGVNLQTIGAISQTGVERVSVGALTHGAVSLDLGLDWKA